MKSDTDNQELEKMDKKEGWKGDYKKVVRKRR